MQFYKDATLIGLAIIFGIIEGLTEFLPVSSTAHLRLAQAYFGISLTDEYWKMFAIVIQLGAILAVVVYFRKRLHESFQNLKNRLLHKIMLAFLITALPAYLSTKLIGHNLENLKLIAWALLVGGLVMLLVDYYFRSATVQDIENTNWKQAASIGFAQFLSALFPGISRSMATIAGGQAVGLSRSAALEFSFLLSIPTMAAATLYDLIKSWRHYQVIDSHEPWLAICTGAFVSFLVAWIVVDWFTRWVRHHGFYLFAWYRIALGTYLLFHYNS